jgi:uncharacterized membrane protein YoaK (UPF0700 family)
MVPLFDISITMFRHKGTRRTFTHNIRLASTLSFVAGIVNVAGVLSVATLTTNVTGHFAYFAEAISLKNYSRGLTYIIFILFFLFGAFVSNLLVEVLSRGGSKKAHTAPMILELIILFSLGLCHDFNKEYLAYALLFAMGLQNAMVTNISQSVVRTTHLTGLFTDLGIELSQLLFYRKLEEVKKLTKSISLRISIIIFFFFGCVLGGILYKYIELRVLVFAALVLITAILFDTFMLYINLIKRRINSNFTK